MSNRVLQTQRLKLRPLDLLDAPEIARLIADWDVIRWLTSPPYPYALSDAELFLSHGDRTNCFAVDLCGDFGDKFVGVVSTSSLKNSPQHELGYWLGKPYWGRGIMSEATAAVVEDCFACKTEPLVSGYLLGNDASENVLTKLGFAKTQIDVDYSRPLKTDMKVQKMQLTHADWLARRG